MKLVCNGQRLSARALSELMSAVGQSELGALMRELGYTLSPPRAPRGLHNGDLVVRLTWWRAEANATITVRSTVRVRAPR